MKTLGIILLLVAILLFTYVATGLFVWTDAAPEDAAPASIASQIVGKMFLFSSLGLLFFGGGLFALIRGRKSRGKRMDRND